MVSDIIKQVRFSSLLLVFFSLLGKNLYAHNAVESNIEFVENKGQWENNVLLKADLRGGWLFLEQGQLTYLFSENTTHGHHHHNKAKSAEPSEPHHHDVRGHAYRTKWIGANSGATVTTEESFPAHSNFFIGNEKSKWQSKVKSWKKVTYQSLYPQIDFKIYSHGNTLKSDYIIRKGGDASRIQVEYDGVDGIEIDEHGRLRIQTSVNEIYELAPYSYQIINGVKTEVKTDYVLRDNKLSFRFPDGYDKNTDLVVDPSLIFSTYSGSLSDNWGASATYDSQGNMYLGGISRGAQYPTTVGALQTVYGGGAGDGACDVVITKFSSDGTTRLYSTYLGGRANELLSSLYSTEDDELIALVITGSNNFPISTNAYQNAYRGGSYASVMDGSMFFQGTDIAVVKFSKDGSSLVGGTYYGGTGNDGLNYGFLINYNYGDESRGDIAVDKEGNIYIASTTASTNLTGTTGNAQATRGGDYDGLVVKFNENLSQVHWATYYGGGSADAAYSIQLDKENNVYIAGGTRSSGIIKTTNGLNRTYRGGDVDGFVAKISSDGKSILSDTYLGTSAYDQAHIMDLDNEGNVYVFGQTLGAYPVSAGVYNNPGSKQFIHKLTPDLSTTVYSTVFGTPNSRYINISPTAFMVDVCGNLYAVGWGGETNENVNRWLGFTNGMPVTSDAYMSSTDGSDFYLINLSRDAKSLIYASFFGEVGSADHVDGGTSRFDKNGVVYQAVCASCGGRNNFPVTPDAYGQNNLADNCNMAGIKYRFDLNAMQVITVTATPPTGCNTLTTKFSYTSTKPGTTYLWEFGDGKTSNEEFPEHTFEQQGEYRVKFTLYNPEDCNPVDSGFVTVKVLLPTSHTISRTLCEGEILEIEGQRFDKEGVYEIILKNQSGCDSILTVNLDYLKKQNTTFQREICHGSSYTFNGKEISVSGIYSDTLKGENGCDSTIVLNLTILSPLQTQIEKTICKGGFVQIDTFRFYDAGNYEVKLISTGGCDSLVTLSLKVEEQLVVNLTEEICAGESYLFQGTQYTQSGTYEIKASGEICDTTYILDLTVHPAPEVKIFVSKNPVEINEEFELHIAQETYQSLQWFPEDIVTSINETPTYAAVEKDTWFKVILTDSNACQATDSVLVKVENPTCLESNVYIPSAFTPNGDGKNDIFLVRSLYPLENFYLIIFNRWGEKVFESQSQENGWEGIWKNQKAETGAYSYVLQAVCNELVIERKGNLTLSR